MAKRKKSMSPDDKLIWQKVAKTVTPLLPTSIVEEAERRLKEFSNSLNSGGEEIVPGPSIQPDVNRKIASRKIKYSQTDTKKVGVPKQHLQGENARVKSQASWHLPDWSASSSHSTASHVHHPIDSKTRRKIVKGRLPIDATLDLHGMTQERAHKSLGRFLDMAHASGFRTVLVITGKGNQGEGVLRRQVPIWLHEPRMAAVSNGFQEAGGSHGGSGALYIRIKRRQAGHSR